MHRIWNEQYLLQAFLAFNNAFEIFFCNSYMHVKHPDELKKAFNSYDTQTIWLGERPGASSLWIKKIT
jgi:hypothetical protein